MLSTLLYLFIVNDEFLVLVSIRAFESTSGTVDGN